MAKTPHELMIDEVRKVFDAHNEPQDKSMAKKLIINVCVSGAFVNRTHNPNIPATAGGVAKMVRDCWNAGAAMWHFHPRNPETDITFLPVPERVKRHKEWCDAVFAVAPDIITDVGAIYCAPPIVNGAVVDEQSIMAETRVTPLVDQLVAMGPNNRYVEVAISLCHVAALGRGTCFLSFNNKPGIESDVRYFQSKGIRVELSPFKHSDVQDVTEWVIEPGLVKPPFILDTLMGVHNSPCPRSMIEAFDLLFTYFRMLPRKEGMLWQSLPGGRFWMPITAVSIMLGADIVRIGIEDEVYLYPHSNELIKSAAQTVEAVAAIAKSLGREVATPAEARQMLNLLQIK